MADERFGKDTDFVPNPCYRPYREVRLPRAKQRSLRSEEALRKSFRCKSFRRRREACPALVDSTCGTPVARVATPAPAAWRGAARVSWRRAQQSPQPWRGRKPLL